jgi:hypothetical protein
MNILIHYFDRKTILMANPQIQRYFHKFFYRIELEITLTSLVKIIQDLEECIKIMTFILRLYK